jgi:sterol desaturase/sphingolipid hydroxylase (fatty acid hydroxylase superfamily)
MNADYKLYILVTFLVLLLMAENLFPLRKMTQPKINRYATNFLMAGLSFILVKLITLRVVLFFSDFAVQNKIGLFQILNIENSLVALALSVLVLDYTLYFWHKLCHQWHFLWRFHLVHHTDMDMDVTTASRFHFGELFFSMFFRSAQVVIFGIDPVSLVLFETLVTLSAQFHHSNLALPKKIDSFINAIFVTPRMHGLHHSVVQSETDSNYSTIFSFWDRLHQTKSKDVSIDKLEIGVAGYQNPHELGVKGLLLLPFTKPRPWRLANGHVPKR